MRTQLLSLVMVPVIAKALGPKKMGELTFATASIGYGLIVVEFGFNDYRSVYKTILYYLL